MEKNSTYAKRGIPPEPGIKNHPRIDKDRFEAYQTNYSKTARLHYLVSFLDVNMIGTELANYLFSGREER